MEAAAEADWKYARRFPVHRLDLLLGARSFADVRDRVVHEARFLCCHVQHCEEDPAFARMAFCYSVSADAFDLFYNSPVGYRGSYFRSPYEGLAANEDLITAMLPKMTDAIPQEADTRERHFVWESLTSPTAKVWLAENGLEQCAGCEGEWGNPSDEIPEIINGRWDTAGCGSAFRGRKAPRLTKIRFFGAFVDNRYNEWLSGRKRHRAWQIHRWGWS